MQRVHERDPRRSSRTTRVERYTGLGVDVLQGYARDRRSLDGRDHAQRRRHAAA
ncbi:MAG: hypothetical protein MZV49_06170 [Rhodopseudomonas palustris]|nr:hypothetical protein [Rhodopseudomonas palustris]